MSDHMLVRRTRWDDGAAKLDEWWELYEYRRSRLLPWKWSWYPATEWVAGMSDMYKEQIRGNREWAAKIAAHYDIKVPEGE